ncbi:hypothetical protein [Lachnobacterium bovis]|uniref:hypothetical protein n=1 Tax=Lachnobacterium bovis TaxID=140626 RepID=UPI000490097A|nr:hypothetical protein [Lachnobacterium bovis]
MKKVFMKILKRNIILVIFSVVLLITNILFYINGCKVFAYLEFKDEVKKSVSEDYELLSCDFSKLKVIKNKKDNYILVDDAKEDRSFDLISKNEIGSYEYDIHGNTFNYYPVSLETQRNRTIKKYEYHVYNLDSKKVTQRIDLKNLLNRYCKDCYWNGYDVLRSEVVYGTDGKTYIVAGSVNPTNLEHGYYELYNFMFYNYYSNNKGMSDDGYAIEKVTYGGLYVSLDQKEIVRSLMYYGYNSRNVFQSVGSSNCKLNSKDVNYNYIYNKVDYEKNCYNYMKEYENYTGALSKVKENNGIKLKLQTDYTNPFCKVKIEFNSSALKSNMTNLFNKYPELKKYVGVKGKKITLFDHDLENDDQVLQLFTPDGKPLSFAGVKDDKVGEITGVADYCQKMKAYNEAHPEDDTQN